MAAVLVPRWAASARASRNPSFGPDGQLPQPGAWVSDVPAVDLTGTWRFDPTASDPMLEAWRGRTVRYRIAQHPGRIDLEFVVEGGLSTRQTYRWDGSARRFQRGEAEVEERARWTDGGRTLEVVGRWWLPAEPEETHRYRFLYRAAADTLTFTQEDDSGTTVWVFVRERTPPG